MEKIVSSTVPTPSEPSNATNKKKKHWQCQTCSMKQEESLIRRGSCGTVQHISPTTDLSVENTDVTNEEKHNQEAAGSINDQKDDPYKRSRSIIRGNFCQLIFYQLFHHSLLMEK